MLTDAESTTFFHPMWIEVLSDCRRWRRGGAVPETESCAEDSHEPPDGDYNHKANETPENKLFPFIALGFIICTKNEIPIDSPQECNERYCNKGWDKKRIYNIEDAGHISV